MLPYRGRLALRAVRAMVGLGCLLVHLIASSGAPSVATLMLAVYAAYGVAALMFRRLASGEWMTAGLAVDLAAFGFWAWVAPSGADPWITPVFFAYVLSSAVLLHEAVHVASILFLSILFVVGSGPRTSSLTPVVIAGGMVALIGAGLKRFLGRRLSVASRESVLFRSEAQLARESERQRMAADFHDGPLQNFISFQMRLEILRKLMQRDEEAARQELEQLQELCRAQVGELRSFVRSMRPPEDGMTLSASLSRMIEQFQRDTGVSVSFLSGDFLDPADTEVSLEVLQIVREALNNVQKHSGATRAAVSISKLDQKLEISVEDNGGGFPFSGTFALEELEMLRLGPASIKRRVKILAGDLVLESRPGQGAELSIRVPV